MNLTNLTLAISLAASAEAAPRGTNTLYLGQSEAEAQAAAHTARGAARGCYQEALATGQRRWSGADLKGAGKRYGDVYERSRQGLVGRMSSAGLQVHWHRGTAHEGPLMAVVMFHANYRRA